MTQIKTGLWVQWLCPVCSLAGCRSAVWWPPLPRETLLPSGGPTDEATTVSPVWGSVWVTRMEGSAHVENLLPSLTSHM